MHAYEIELHIRVKYRVTLSIVVADLKLTINQLQSSRRIISVSARKFYLRAKVAPEDLF